MSIIAFVFVFPIIDNLYFHDIFPIVAYTLVIMSIFSILENKNKWMKWILIVAIIANIVLFVDSRSYIQAATFVISVVTFTIATGLLIAHISAHKNVSIGVVVQAICGYMLIGIIGSLLNGILLIFDPDAISIVGEQDKFSSLIYYTFITLTTIGYGEITPLTASARSVSIFVGVSGQIYLTVIIAMIVGKFLSLKNSKP